MQSKCYFVCLNFLPLFLNLTGQLRSGQEERERHTAKCHRVESNRGPLQRGHSRCTWGDCSTNVATRATRLFPFQIFYSYLHEGVRVSSCSVPKSRPSTSDPWDLVLEKLCTADNGQAQIIDPIKGNFTNQ